MGAAAIVTRVLAQLQEFFDIEVPGFEIRTHGTFAFATLIDRNRGIVHHFQKRHHTLRFAVGTFDVRTQCPHRRPVVAEATREFRQERVFFQRFVNAVEIIGNRRQIAAR